MEISNPVSWSKLPLDILRSVFELLNFVDFHRAKMVCSTWYCASKQTIPRNSESLWLILSPENGNCAHLYNPDEDMFYSTQINFSRVRILANCGKWSLLLDSRSNLHVVDVFTDKSRIDLPPLDSLVSDDFAVKRVGDTEFTWELLSDDSSVFESSAGDLKARLCVDEKAGELALVWFFNEPAAFLCLYKKGNDHYSVVPLRRPQVPKYLNGIIDIVLRGYRLYVLVIRHMVRVIDFSGQQGLEEISGSNPYPMFSHLPYSSWCRIVVTTHGEVLMVGKPSLTSFQVYKKDPDSEPDDWSPDLLEVNSLGDEAMLLDLGITVPANPAFGIKPNTIYFSGHDHICIGPCFDSTRGPIPYKVDVCEFDIASKTLKPFPALANMNLKDARWILPSMT